MTADSRPDHRPEAMPPPIPEAARWLGATGAIPFVGLAVGSLLLDADAQSLVLFALAAYGAVILSFLGGVHWGLAIGGVGSASEQGALSGRLTLSVVPSLVGWAALLAPATVCLLVLAVAFVLMLWIDVQAGRNHRVPAWYPQLRWPLTLVVVTFLVLGALG